MGKKKLLLTGAAVLLAAALAVCFAPKLRTQAFVALYHDEIEAGIAADGSVPADDVTLFGYRSVNTWERDGNRMTEFVIGTRGLVANSCFFGCFYSPNDVPAGFQNVDVELVSDGEDRWTWQGEGDNCGSVEKLRDKWYYFEAKF